MGFYCQFERLQTRLQHGQRPWKNATFFRHWDPNWRVRLPFLFQGKGSYSKVCYNVELTDPAWRQLTPEELLLPA